MIVDNLVPMIKDALEEQIPFLDSGDNVDNEEKSM